MHCTKILRESSAYLKEAIDYQSSLFMDKIRETIRALLKKQNFNERLDRLVDKIMAITDWVIEKRLEVVKKVQEWVTQFRLT